MCAIDDVFDNSTAAAGVIMQSSPFGRWEITEARYADQETLGLPSPAYWTIMATGRSCGSLSISRETEPAKAAPQNAEKRMSDFEKNPAKRSVSIRPFRVPGTSHFIAPLTHYNQYF